MLESDGMNELLYTTCLGRICKDGVMTSLSVLSSFDSFKNRYKEVLAAIVSVHLALFITHLNYVSGWFNKEFNSKQ